MIFKEPEVCNRIFRKFRIFKTELVGGGNQAVVLLMVFWKHAEHLQIPPEFRGRGAAGKDRQYLSEWSVASTRAQYGDLFTLTGAFSVQEV